MVEYYSLSSLTILLLAVRVYYAQFAEFKQLNVLNNYFHEVMITFFGVISLHNMLQSTKKIQKPYEIVGSVIFMMGIYILHMTHREMKGSFSPRIDYDENRKLINTGIFRVVRHPMYLSLVLLNMGIWLITLYEKDGMLFFFNNTFTLLVLSRIPIEEKYLRRQFPNYEVVMPRFRVFPYIY